MGRSRTGLTRRGFLEMAAMAGGTTALHETMVALGLVRPPEAEAYQRRPKLRKRTGDSALLHNSNHLADFGLCM